LRATQGDERAGAAAFPRLVQIEELLNAHGFGFVAVMPWPEMLRHLLLLDEWKAEKRGCGRPKHTLSGDLDALARLIKSPKMTEWLRAALIGRYEVLDRWRHTAVKTPDGAARSETSDSRWQEGGRELTSETA
jgi:hypothetical protein